MKVLTAPEPLILPKKEKTLFLGGTIDNGNSIDWQQNVIDFMRERIGKENVTILNPRRRNWNKEVDPDSLYRQIDWEVKAMERSTHILFNILPNSQSPITLFEIGSYIRDTTKKIYVVCSEEYFRFGNVQFYCQYYNVSHSYTLSQALREIIDDLKGQGTAD